MKRTTHARFTQVSLLLVIFGVGISTSIWTNWYARVRLERAQKISPGRHHSS